MRSMACPISPRASRLLLVYCAVVLLWAGLVAEFAAAQTFDASNLREPADLASTWLASAGDNPAYAQKGFDDSRWIRFDPHLGLRSAFPASSPEVVWYRLHVMVAPNDRGLALSVRPPSGAFEVYVNGQRLIRSGKVSPFEPYTTDALLIQRIPDSAIASGSLLVALRVHFTRTDWDFPFKGAIAGYLTIGQEGTLRDRRWASVMDANAFDWFNQLLGFGLGIVALALFTAQSRQKEYLWIFLQFFAGALMFPLSMVELFHNIPAQWGLLGSALVLTSMIFLVLMYFAFLHIPLGRWIQALMAVSILSVVILEFPVTMGSVSLNLMVIFLLPYLVLIAGVIPVILIIHWRRGNREAGILLIPSTLSSLNLYVDILSALLMQIPAFAHTSLRAQSMLDHMQIGRFTPSVSNFGDLLYVLSLSVIMVRRSTRISRQQALLEGELEAARELQQFILPNACAVLPGLEIESEYHPARTVGGDFFQIIPHPTDGSLLIVAGDVTGKGLKASMLVALLVGAIRTTVRFDSDPLRVLKELNQRLLGRGDAQATCLALRIDAAGEITLANAGHIAPYLSGEPIPMEGALPLGMIEGAEFSVMEFTMNEHDRLVLMSDGIVEATDAKGKLFGFERVHELLRAAVTAAHLATAAQTFGQEDDISIISITRTDELTPAMA